MESALNAFLKACFASTKEEALALWDATIRPLLTEEHQNVAHPDYSVTADQRWWLWCERFKEEAQGEQALQRLLLSSRLSWEASQSLQRKALGYVLPLPTVRTVVFKPAAGRGYVASSPFVLPNPKGGILVNVRHVNYQFTPDNNYPLLPEYVASAPTHLKNRVRTVNVIHTCADDLTIESTTVLKDHTTFMKWPSPVLDLEDLRLVALPSGRLLGLAASREIVVSTLPQPVLVTVDLENTECKGGVWLRAHTPDLERVTQKNWLPFWCARTKKVLVFYSYGPEAIIYEVEPTTGMCSVFRKWTTGTAMHAVRGGAPLVEWENGMYLSVVHTSLQDPGVRRKYFHRFVLHASDYQPIAMSQQWNFSGDAYDAEFVISCMRSASGSYYVGYGQNDGVSNVAEVAADTIKNLWWYKVRVES